MAYEFNPADVVELSHVLGIETRQQGDELHFRLCPYCRGGDNLDKKTFAVNLDGGAFKCFRSSCGKQGHFVELARDFNFQLDYGQEKQYRRLPQKPIEVRDPAVEYMEGRGIPRAVTEQYQITTQKQHENILVFPFYDDKGELVFVKYRNTKYSGQGNKEWCEKDARPILFGMQQCRGTDRLIVTEGQIDSLSLAACGIQNAVSVPTGARGFTWLTHCREWMIQFDELIVFGDHEHGKITLADELLRNLATEIRIKVVRPEDYLGEKDANAILQKYGKQAVQTAVTNAIQPPVRHVKELADVQAVDLNTLPRIKTNIRELDKVVGGLFLGQVILLTGKRGEGKSTFGSQLAVEALDQEQPVFIYSGELTDYHFKRWLDFQAAGPDNVVVSQNEYGDEVYSLAEETVSRINAWYRGKAFIYDNNALSDDKSELESLTETIEKTVRQKGIKLVLVDNLMTAIDAEVRDDLYSAQSKFVRKLKDIAMQYDVAVLLIAHPRKSRDDFTNDDVSGSADITNRVDYVMCYERTGDEDQTCDSQLLVTKNRLTGRLVKKENAIKLFYSQSTKRITSMASKTRRYGWEHADETIGEDALLTQELPF